MMGHQLKDCLEETMLDENTEEELSYRGWLRVSVGNDEHRDKFDRPSKKLASSTGGGAASLPEHVEAERVDQR